MGKGKRKTVYFAAAGDLQVGKILFLANYVEDAKLGNQPQNYEE